MRLISLLGLLWLTAGPLVQGEGEMPAPRGGQGEVEGLSAVEDLSTDVDPATVDALLSEEGGEERELGHSFADETDSVVVEVPVEVLVDGQPLRGLSAEDFILFDNGTRQTLSAVDVIDLPSLRSETAELDMPVAARRHYLLLFDLSFNSPAGLARAQRSALDLVERRLHPTDLVAVATFGLQEGVRLVLGFSPDRSQVRLTLASLAQQREIRWRPDPLQLYLGTRDDRARPTGDAAALERQGEPSLETFQHLLDRQAEVQSRRDVQILTQSMESLARLLRAARGHKQVLLFSEGFDSRLLAGEGDQERRDATQRAIQTGHLAQVDSDAVFGSRSVVDQLTRLAEELRRSDCTVHGIDVGPVQDSGRDGLVTLARDTGGEFIASAANTEEAFGRLARRSTFTYLLAYRPDELAMDGSYRKIRVKLKDSVRNARVVHRPGYFAAASYPEGISARLALAERMLDRQGGAIKARVHAVPTAEAVGDRHYVPVVVEVKGPSFLGRGATDGSGSVVDAEVFVYALGKDGGIVDYFSQGISFDLANHGDSLRRNGFKLFAPLLLPSGRFTLRALVRNADQDRLGVALSSLSVPALAKEARAQRLPEKLLDPEWLLVRAERRDLSQYPQLPDPLELVAAEIAARKAPIAPTRPGPALPGAPAVLPAPPVDDVARGLPARYRAALALYAAGPPQEGLVELERFEVEAAGSDPNRAPRLTKAELETLRRLIGKGDAEPLWPVLLAHHDLFFLHRAAKRPYLELHSRQMVGELADLMAVQGSDGVRVAAGQALASLGCALVADGRSAGFGLMEHSLEVDPANEATHLCMASYYEKFGGPYAKAVEWLEQLVARRPESREGRLRLAVNNLRVGDESGSVARRQLAAELFEGLIDEKRPDWVTSVASQELSRYWLRTRDFGRALEVLELAAVRQPADQELLVQLSFLYDRLGRDRSSQETVARVGEGRPGGARGRYNQWTSDALQVGRRELKVGAESRFLALDAALGTALEGR
jgi:VWFA-related protein